MAGFEARMDSNGNRTLGLGRLRPTPNAVPQGGFDGPISNGLRAKLAQERNRQAQQVAHAVGLMKAPEFGRQPTPYDQGMLSYGRSGPMPAGSYRAMHPTGGIDSAPGKPGLLGADDQINGRLGMMLSNVPQPNYHSTTRPVQNLNGSPSHPAVAQGQGLLAGIPIPQHPQVPPISMPSQAEAPIPFAHGVTPEKWNNLPPMMNRRSSAVPGAMATNQALAARTPIAPRPAEVPSGPIEAALTSNADPAAEVQRQHELLARQYERKGNPEMAASFRAYGAQAAQELRNQMEQHRAQINSMAENTRLAKAQADMTAQTAKMSPKGRADIDRYTSGLATPDEAMNAIAPLAPPVPINPGVAPTYDQARAALFSGEHPMMGPNFESSLSKPGEGSPIDDYQKALDMGYDLSDPNSALSNHFQALLMGRHGRAAIEGAKEAGGHYFSPEDPNDVRRRQWFRDDATPGVPMKPIVPPWLTNLFNPFPSGLAVRPR